ncbi:MAG TPA: hypothetical protein HPP83_04490 [Candidatus Hydrogenedentes bacterium]|nr:hypothetical protein [Candidatus Hydrogenedentota bacterium]
MAAIARHLRSGGAEAVAAAVEDVRRKDMADRAELIEALGEGRYEDAAPALKTIVRDETENAGLRSVALRALARIKGDQAAELVRRYEDGDMAALERAAADLLESATE